MKKLLYLFSVLVIVSCNSQTNKAISYNNSLIEEQEFIGSQTKSYLDAIQDSSQFDKLDELKNQLLKDIENSLSVIEKLDNFNGNSEFKKSVVSVIKAYQEGVVSEYEAIAKYQLLPATKKTIDKKWQADQHAKHADDNITEKEDYFILMQQKFAKENGIDLE